MSEKRARYTGGSMTGVDLTVPVGNGEEFRHIHVKHGGELPTVIGGLKVPASYRDSLLEQADNWSEVKRATGDETKGDDTKEGDR